jgi:arylsulfatase A-like enzyme
VAHAANNILLLIADDFGIDVAAFYPTWVRVETTPPAPFTPNLAALAARGVRFDAAWATPWCSPTRAGILTGRYGFRTGIGSPGLNALPWTETTLPEAFLAAGRGYLLAHLGKWHVSDGIQDPNLHGWTHYAGPEPYRGRIGSYFQWQKVVDGVVSKSTTYATTETVNDTIAVIERARAEARPYLAWVAFNAPHKPYHKPPLELHSRDYLPDPGEVPVEGAARRAYYEAAVEALDTEIGRLLSHVDFATTTVIFLGDNGTIRGATAKPYDDEKAKGSVYEAGIHVPLVVAGAAVANPGRAVTAMVDAVDLFPTILELGGISTGIGLPVGIQLDGLSLMPYLADVPHPTPRQWSYAESFTATPDTEWERAVRDGSYVLIQRFDGPPEMYNLIADPLQRTNLLAGPLGPAEQAAMTVLTARLRELMATR